MTTATISARITETWVKPRCPPSISPYTSAESATTARICPAQSNRAGLVGELSTANRNASMLAHTGRLMRNTHRQSAVVRRPPSGWPMSPATAPPTAQTPSALARARGSGKASRIRAIDAGSMTAAAAPWTPRAAISTPMLGAAAHPADASPNTSRPSQSARLAPIRSARLPANSNSAANNSV
ncbi:hypothetical protein GCM10027569_78160 [Flindersiella endophytica]